MAIVLQIKRGLKVNLPASGAAGELFLTTDTNELYLGTGSALTPLDMDWANLLNVPGGLGEILVNAQTGVSYTVVTGDSGKLITLSNASPVAVTLPQAGSAGFASGKYFYFQNKGVGAATITPTTSTINGAANLVLRTNGHVLVVSDGTNYQVFGVLPNPSTTTLGGVNSKAAIATQFLTAVGTDGVISSAQPAFTDISGQMAAAQLPSTIDLGTF